MTDAFGWAFPGNSRKAHYIEGSMSLCRKWGFYFGPVSPDDGEAGPNDCVICRRELDRRLTSSEKSDGSGSGDSG